MIFTDIIRKKIQKTNGILALSYKKTYKNNCVWVTLDTQFLTRFHLQFFGIGTGTDQDFCPVSMRTTVLDDGFAILSRSIKKLKANQNNYFFMIPLSVLKV